MEDDHIIGDVEESEGEIEYERRFAEANYI